MPQGGCGVTLTLHPPSHPIVTSFLSFFLAGLLWVTPVSSLNCPLFVPPLFFTDAKHNLNNLSPTAPVSPLLICPAPPLHCLAPPFLSIGWVSTITTRDFSFLKVRLARTWLARTPSRRAALRLALAAVATRRSPCLASALPLHTRPRTRARTALAQPATPTPTPNPNPYTHALAGDLLRRD